MVKKNKAKREISNRLLYTVIVVSILIGIGVGVYAYGTSNPSSIGHSAGELDLSGGVNGNAIFNGNVGIGTNAPSSKLDVVGNVKGTGLCIGSDCRASWPSVLNKSSGSSCINPNDALIAKKWIAQSGLTSEAKCPPSNCVSSTMWRLASDPAPSCTKYFCPSGPGFPACINTGNGCQSSIVAYTNSEVACFS